MSGARVGLRVDCDTLVGTRDGVPALDALGLDYTSVSRGRGRPFRPIARHRDLGVETAPLAALTGSPAAAPAPARPVALGRVPGRAGRVVVCP